MTGVQVEAEGLKRPDGDASGGHCGPHVHVRDPHLQASLHRHWAEPPSRCPSLPVPVSVFRHTL